MSPHRTPEDIVRRFTYDPTGTDPEPPWPMKQRQWKRSLKWLAIAVGFVVGVLMVTAL